MNTAKKVSSIISELKNFAFKGNVVDLAVGVIIGAAFGKIIDSLVKHLITCNCLLSLTFCSS